MSVERFSSGSSVLRMATGCKDFRVESARYLLLRAEALNMVLGR
jgi:hypothetical protein